MILIVMMMLLKTLLLMNTIDKCSDYEYGGNLKWWPVEEKTGGILKENRTPLDQVALRANPKTLNFQYFSTKI